MHSTTDLVGDFRQYMSVARSALFVQFIKLSSVTPSPKVRTHRHEQFKCAHFHLSPLPVTALLLTFVLLFQAIIPLAFAKNGERKSLSAKASRAATPRYTESLNAPLRNRTLLPQETAVEAATVRRLGNLDGRIEGSVRQLNAEDITLSGGAVITSALLLPGTPEVRLNGNPSFGGTVQGTGSPSPSNYRVTLNSNSTLDRLVNRVDPIQLPTVAPPPASTGTRDVTINNPGDSAGDFATVRNLTLNSNAGNVTVPPGTYRNFKANGNSNFTFGIAGSAQPAIYNLNSLDLNGNSRLQIAGPVVLTVSSSLSLNSAVGSSSDPLLLTLKIAAGGLTLNGGASLYGVVHAPTGTVTINGNSLLQGSVTSDRLTINGNGTLKGTAGVLTSITPTTAVQGQTLTVTLHGINTRWINGQTLASFGGEISVGGAPEGESGPVQVLDSVTAVASLLVSPTAALAPRTVRVTTPIAGFSEGAVEVLINAFTVIANPAPGASTATVSTLAGTGTAGFTDGAPAQAQFGNPTAIAAGAGETLYVADAGNHSIRRIAADGTVTTLAGNGTAGFADGNSLAARFTNPQGIAVDASGAVFVADTGNHRIRRISSDGTVTTVAGDGTVGLTNGQGAQARFNSPQGIALDNTGGLYVADTGNHVVRYLSASGDVSTVAGDGSIGSSDSPARFSSPVGVAFDGSTLFVYLADSSNHRIRRVTPGGNVITIAGAGRGFADGTASQARFADPAGLAIDGAGKLIITEATNSLLRMVDADKATSGAAGAVTTIAGTGARGLTNGAGNVARFNTPRGVAVMQSSAMIIVDTGNHVLRKVTLPPVLTSFNPAQAQVGQTVILNGERFDARASSRNTVLFVRSTQAGGGTTPAQVLNATRSQLTVLVPQDATTGNVTVQTEGGTAISATPFTVVIPPPVITDFNPKRGPVGTQVTLVGNYLTAGVATPVVTFAGASGARLNALVNSATPTQVRVTVPNAAVTGVIQLTNSNGTASTQSFSVEGGPLDYQLTLAPTVASAVQHTSATYVVYATGSSSFTQLIALSVTGLPAGVVATFAPAQITAGAISTLTLNLANANLAAGSFPFTIRGSALVDGSDMIRNSAGSLTVVAAGQTTLSGRVLSTDNEPIIGATASLDGKTATTDAAGSFLLVGVNAGVDRALMVDGRTASAPNRTYPIILEPATIIAGQANVNPYTFYLPAIDTQYEVTVIPNQNTVVSTPKVPGLRMTIPAGANLRNRDGSPVARTSLTPVPIDRTPAPLPANVPLPIVFTSQPGGAIADVAMPVIYPNLTGLDPGTRSELYAFNHDTVQWYIYGYGRVSSDGRTIEPEIDPATGKLYGLRDFSWHGPVAPPTGNAGDSGPCPTNTTGNPVDLSTGMKKEMMTDVAFGGARGSLGLTRIYTSDFSTNSIIGRFGRGWKDNFDIQLTGTFQQGGAGRVVLPDQRTGRLFNYARTEADGTLVFTSSQTITQLGDEVRKLSAGTFEYRYASGEVMRFNSNGKLTAMVDLNQNTTTLTYTGANLTQISDAVGRSLSLQYDSSNRIAQVSDPLGRVWQYTYDTSGRLVAVDDPETVGGPVRYGYNAQHLLTSVTDKRGNLVKQVSYDANNRVIGQQFAEGGFETYDYTLSGGIVTGTVVTDSLGRKMKKRMNSSGYVIEQEDALGQMSRTDREIGSNVAKATTGPCGCAEVTREFDTHGNVIQTTDRLGQTERFEYQAQFDRITKAVDKLGRITLFGYDERGNLTSITDALNQTATLSYDQHGQVTAITDPLGHISRLEYDAQGNITARIDALGNRTITEYDGIGRVTAMLDPLSRRATVQYDVLGRPTTMTDASGTTTQFGYDANSNQTSVTDALNRVWRSSFDARNRLTNITDPLDRVMSLTFDTEDQLLTMTSASGRTLRYSYDNRGQRVTATDALQGIVRFTYSSRGKLIALADPRGNATTFSYDELYRLVSTRDPLGRESRVSYDAAGRVSESIDRLGRRVMMQYDAIDRLASVAYADATVNYSYDAASRPTRIDDTQSGSVSWAYDDADRLLSETTAAGVAHYAYNAASQVTSMTAADRAPVSYGYDTAGRLQSITQGTETFTHSYDAISRLTSLQRPNGITTSYSYDTVNRLSRLLHSNAQSQAIEDYRYTYNRDDEIEAITSLASTPLLPQAKTASAADAADRVAQSGANSYSFDHLGQTISKSDAAGTTTYNWDARGRLTSATLPGNQTISYGYDALGRRASRTAAGATTSFLYAGADVVLDRASDGSSVDYLNGGGIDNKLRQTSAASSQYFLQDHLGSTTALTDASGGVVERQSYEPFGATNGSALTRYGYTGRERDEATGLMYNRARWYDPQQARFLSEDPAGFGSGSTNRYSYVSNNPLSHTDPTGMFAWAAVWALVEVGLTIADAIALVSTLADDCVSTGDKLKALAWFGLGAIGPLGGGAVIARWGGKIKKFGGKSWRWVKGALGFSDNAAGLARKKIALGLDDYLDDFAAKNGADTHRQFAAADPNNWKSYFLQEMSNPSNEVLFNLDGVQVSATRLQRAAGGVGGATDWELLQISQNPQWWDRIKWIKDGVEVPNPFQ